MIICRCDINKSNAKKWNENETNLLAQEAVFPDLISMKAIKSKSEMAR